MNDNTKLEVAKDIVAKYLADTYKMVGFDLNNEEVIKLLALKEEVERNNEEAIDYVLGLSNLGDDIYND